MIFLPPTEMCQWQTFFYLGFKEKYDNENPTYSFEREGLSKKFVPSFWTEEAGDGKDCENPQPWAQLRLFFGVTILMEIFPKT